MVEPIAKKPTPKRSFALLGAAEDELWRTKRGKAAWTGKRARTSVRDLNMKK